MEKASAGIINALSGTAPAGTVGGVSEEGSLVNPETSRTLDRLGIPTGEGEERSGEGQESEDSQEGSPSSDAKLASLEGQVATLTATVQALLTGRENGKGAQAAEETPPSAPNIDPARLEALGIPKESVGAVADLVKQLVRGEVAQVTGPLRANAVESQIVAQESAFLNSHKDSPDVLELFRQSRTSIIASMKDDARKFGSTPPLESYFVVANKDALLRPGTRLAGKVASPASVGTEVSRGAPATRKTVAGPVPKLQGETSHRYFERLARAAQRGELGAVGA